MHVYFLSQWLQTELPSDSEKHWQECREQTCDSEDGDGVICFGLSSTFFTCYRVKLAIKGTDARNRKMGEIKGERENYLIFSRENYFESGHWCCRKKLFFFEQLFLTHFLGGMCFTDSPPPLPPTVLLKSEHSESSLLTCERDLSIFIWAPCTSHDTNTFQMLRYKITT